MAAPRSSNTDGNGSESDGEELEQYLVEKILDKKIKKGQEWYLIKWQGYPDEDNTWEPLIHINCKEMIEAFENQRLERVIAARKKRAAAAAKAEKMKKKKAKKLEKKRGTGTEVRGFARGLRPEKVIGATDTGGVLQFRIKWEGSEEVEFVLAKEANVKCPHLVIAFYEERISWREDAAAAAEDKDNDDDAATVIVDADEKIDTDETMDEDAAE